MLRHSSRPLLLGLIATGVAACATLSAKSAGSSPGLESRLRAASLKAPLTFEVNRGQTDPQVKFLARGPGYTLFLTPQESLLQLRIADCGLRNAD